MNVHGLHKTSLLDYPGKISAVLFTSGCNFNCPFCHNPELINPQLASFEMKEVEILEFLEKRKKILDAIVITGGEPTIQPDLVEFIKKIKKLGYLIKLDTNGTNPKIVKQLLKNKLIDYIAMDIKGTLKKYPNIVCKNINLDDIAQSVELIKKSHIANEFRTTVVPTLHEKKDFVKIGEWLTGAKNYYIQQFRNEKTLNPDFRNITPFTDEKLHEFERIMKKYVKNVGIRGI
jgi:pyruvate formate lyase activating enzyme